MFRPQAAQSVDNVGFMPEQGSAFHHGREPGMLHQSLGNSNWPLPFGSGDQTFDGIWKTPPTFTSTGSFTIPPELAKPGSGMTSMESMNGGTGWKETLGAAVSGIRLH